MPAYESVVTLGTSESKRGGWHSVSTPRDIRRSAPKNTGYFWSSFWGLWSLFKWVRAWTCQNALGSKLGVVWTGRAFKVQYEYQVCNRASRHNIVLIDWWPFHVPKVTSIAECITCSRVMHSFVTSCLLFCGYLSEKTRICLSCWLPPTKLSTTKIGTNSKRTHSRSLRV